MRAVRRGADPAAMSAQVTGDQRRDVGVVVDDKYMGLCSVLRPVNRMHRAVRIRSLTKILSKHKRAGDALPDTGRLHGGLHLDLIADARSLRRA